MEPFWEAGLNTSRWLQTNYPQIEGFMRLLSDLGVFELYLAVILWLYWCTNKERGRQLAYLLSIGYVLMALGKHLTRQPRPFWLDESLLTGAGPNEGYGFPSGHVTMITVVMLFAADWLRRTWMWGTAVVVILLMGLSRIYLAHHFPHDTAAGLLLGSAVVGGFVLWRYRFQAQFRDLILGQRFWSAVTAPLSVLAVYGLGLFILGAPDPTADMQELAMDAEIYSYREGTAAVAMMLGLGMGFILEPARIRFLVEGEWWRRILRYGIGLGIVLGGLTGLGAAIDALLPPSTILAVELLFRFARYLFMAFVGSYLLPLLFVATGLADAAPAPKVQTSLNRLHSKKL